VLNGSFHVGASFLQGPGGPCLTGLIANMALLVTSGILQLAGSQRPHVAFDKYSCGRSYVVQNISYGGRALLKTLCLLYEDGA